MVVLKFSLITVCLAHDINQLNTSLQAIAARATYHKTMTVCFVYFFSVFEINSTELEDLVNKQSHYLIAHCSQCGCTTPCLKKQAKLFLL